MTVPIAATLATCPFCEIAADRAKADMVRSWPGVIAFRPLNPVVPGHTLVVPRMHVRDLSTDPLVTGMVMARAAELALGLVSCNLITSQGSAATQTVFHLHVHLVPRRHGDGLHLPWTGQKVEP